MKKQTFLFVSILIFLITACGSETTDETIPQEPTKEISIDKFSNPFTYQKDTISILGKNFPTKKEDIKVYLDSKLVNIEYSETNKIHIKLSELVSLNPELKIEIENSNITYSDDFKNLVVLNNTKGEWISMPNYYDKIAFINEFKALDKEYISLSINTDEYIQHVHNSNNGGFSIKEDLRNINYSEDDNHFITKEGHVYYYLSSHLSRVDKNGERKILNNNEGFNGFIKGVYVNDDETIITVGTIGGAIYTSTDFGETFTEIHRNNPSKLEFTTMTGFGEDKVWLAGYNFPWNANGTEKTFIPAKILYKKNDGTWFNNNVEIEPDAGTFSFQKILKIDFIDANNGYAIAEISRGVDDKEYFIINSKDGGDTWNIIHRQLDFINALSFKNSNEGWFVAGNNIYKTTNGGTSWNIDYTNDTACKGVLYNDGIIWVIAEGKTLKYYE